MGTSAGSTPQPFPEVGIITKLHKPLSLQGQNNLLEMAIVRFEAVLKLLFFSADELMEVDLASSYFKHPKSEQGELRSTWGKKKISSSLEMTG